MSREVPHLTRAQREALRERLVACARTLSGEISQALHSGDLEVPADERETGDVAATVGLAGAQRDTHELREIEAALARMDSGAYGLCVDCGTALPWVRLDARPESGRCVHCESAHERGRSTPSL